MELFKLVGKIVVDASEANQKITATIEASEELAAMFGTVATKADTAGDKLSNRSKIGAGAVWLGNTLHTLTNKLGHFVASAFKSGLDFNASIEKAQVQFAALLRNEEQAETLVRKLQEFAKISPLGLEGVTQNAVELLSAGTKLEDIIPTLEMLGNLSLGDSTKMDYVVRAYTQVMNIGKLKAQEINQLINAGVPIIRLLTEYGGEKFADGTWYQDFLNNPKEFYVTAEEFRNAMTTAASGAGEYATVMNKMMDSYSGKLEKLGDEGKEAMGKVMKPFNDTLAAKVFPKITELLASIGAWADANSETIGAFAEALGNFAVWGMQALVDGFKYLAEHPEILESVKETIVSIGDVLKGIGKLFNPERTPLETKAAENPGKKYSGNNEYIGAYQELTGKYAHWTDEQKEVGRAYLQAMMENPYEEESFYLRKLNRAQQNVFTNLPLQEQMEFYQDALTNLGEKGLSLEITETWFNEGTESDLQSQLAGYQLTVPVKATFSGFSNWLGNIITNTKADSSNASGLRYVPRDGHISRLHMGEMVLPRHEADEYRRNGGSTDISRLENAINSLSDRVFGIMQQVAMNTAGNQIVCLETGAIVGQTVRQMDTKLGDIATKKGRRN